MTRFVDVVLPVAVDKEFTYAVPPELQPFAAAGVRVIVPFGRKYATGLITQIRTQSPVPSPKPLRDIIDPGPVFSDELLRLCRWIAEYYFCPLGEVFKAAMPHGLLASKKRLVRLIRAVKDPAASVPERESPRRTRILSILAEEGEMLSMDLQKKAGIKRIDGVLSAMVRAGLIETEAVLPRPATRPRRIRTVRIEAVDGERLAAAIGSLPPRKKKALALLSLVRTLRDEGTHEIAVTELLKRSNSTTTVLNEFSAIGLLPVSTAETFIEDESVPDEDGKVIILNPFQQRALSEINAAIATGTPKTILLHGVTASGKTQVYIEAMRSVLDLGKSAIVLVPEISLTPQIVRRFRKHFDTRVAVVHSRMSPGERHEVWRRARSGESPIIIGPRSAVFAPVANLGLIVVDEEHEASYKQFDAAPRYHARDVAVVRGAMNNAVVILGSATPSAESYFNAATGKYRLIEMPLRIDAVPMPSITIVDMSAERKRTYGALKQSLPEGSRNTLRKFQQPAISGFLREKIADRLARGEGIILLQNRRGFAPFFECPDCGYTETCERCSVTLTYHLVQKHLRCHYCGLIRSPRAECPSCGSSDLQLHGIGTQRVEQELERLFPEARVARMDLDTTSRKGAHGRLLKKFADGQADILLGTQMVAKGLDFPRVTLVGVISADTQMLLPDFRASERTFQLLTQVAGRAGRSTLLGEVVIQTYQPGHYTLKHVVDHDYPSFYTEELQSRRELSYPPFSRLVLIELKGTEEEKVRASAERFAHLLAGGNGAFTVLGPAPAVIGKINNQFRWHIIIKNFKDKDPGGLAVRTLLHDARAQFDRRRHRDVRLIIDVDPAGLM